MSPVLMTSLVPDAHKRTYWRYAVDRRHRCP